METTMKSDAAIGREAVKTNEVASMSSPAYQAYTILLIGFTVAPIIAGLDKFFNVLTNWTQYLSPIASNILGGASQQFMYLVGVIEIVAGIGVFLKPKDIRLRRSCMAWVDNREPFIDPRIFRRGASGSWFDVGCVGIGPA